MVSYFTREITHEMVNEFKEENDDDNQYKGFYVVVRNSMVLAFWDVDTGMISLDSIYPDFKTDPLDWDKEKEINFDDDSPPLWESYPLTKGMKIVVPPSGNFLTEDVGDSSPTPYNSVEISDS